MKPRICSTTVILVILIVFFFVLLGLHFVEMFSLYLKDRNVFRQIVGLGREGMDTAPVVDTTVAPDDLTKKSATNLKPVLAQLEAYIYS